MSEPFIFCRDYQNQTEESKQVWYQYIYFTLHRQKL